MALSPWKAWLLMLLILGSSKALAQGAGLFWQTQTTRLAGYMANYSGLPEESLTGQRGFGGEVVTERGWQWLSLQGKVVGEYSKSEADFNENGTTTELEYELFMAEAHLGARMALLPSKNFAPYLGAYGVLGLVSLTFPDGDDLTDLQQSQSAYSFGYVVAAGVELRIIRDGNKKFILYGELQSKVSRAQLADENAFSLDCLKIVGGIGW